MNSENRHISFRERRKGIKPDEVTLDDHVAPHLVTPLWEWCRRQGLFASTTSGRRVLTEKAKRMCLPLGVPTPRSPSDLEASTRQEPDLLLDMADWLLREGHQAEEREKEIDSPRKRIQQRGANRTARRTLPSGFSRAVSELESILFEGRSALAVGEPPDHLIERLPRELVEEFEGAIAKDDEISGYLRKAWSAAWRRDNPSAKEAYDAAVKALEAILAPIVIPNESKPTLGKIIGELGAKHNNGKWTTRFRQDETVQTLKALLDELWKSDSRHAGMPPNSLEQAQDAVTIAVAVVALVRRGFLTRVDDS